MTYAFAAPVSVTTVLPPFNPGAHAATPQFTLSSEAKKQRWPRPIWKVAVALMPNVAVPGELGVTVTMPLANPSTVKLKLLP